MFFAFSFLSETQETVFVFGRSWEEEDGRMAGVSWSWRGPSVNFPRTSLMLETLQSDSKYHANIETVNKIACRDMHSLNTTSGRRYGLEWDHVAFFGFGWAHFGGYVLGKNTITA